MEFARSSRGFDSRRHAVHSSSLQALDDGHYIGHFGHVFVSSCIFKAEVQS